MSSLNKRLIKAMADTNMKQADLCRATGILKSLMSVYVNGSVQPKIDNLILIAKTLNVNPSWLLFSDEESQLGSNKGMKRIENNIKNINILASVLLEQINALAEWNLKNIKMDTEHVRKNKFTIAEIIPLTVSLNQSESNERI